MWSQRLWLFVMFAKADEDGKQVLTAHKHDLGSISALLSVTWELPLPLEDPVSHSKDASGCPTREAGTGCPVPVPFQGYITNGK